MAKAGTMPGTGTGSGGNDIHGGGRYLSLGPADRQAMLEVVGASTIDELFASIPASVRFADELPLEDALAEVDLLRDLEAMSVATAGHRGLLSFQGAGCYPHYVPTHVDALIQRQEFMTVYTPYQAEVGQGTLQSIFEFQSLVCALTEMEVCNASMYDGGSSVAEAVLMARRLQRRGGRVLWSEGLHPGYRAVAETYATHLDVDFELVPVGEDGRTQTAEIDDDVLAVIVQQPNFFGVMEDLTGLGSRVAESKAKFVVASAEPLAFALARPPGRAGADIVVGELQSFGNSTNFGGPLVGFMACRDRDKRNLPGRLVGRTVDADGKPGFVLTLATREQHIRRARATSNICTNEALCALASCIAMCSFGREGLRELASINLAKATFARGKLEESGFRSVYGAGHFNEFVIELDVPAQQDGAAAADEGLSTDSVPAGMAEVIRRCAAEGVIPGVPLGRFRSNGSESGGGVWAGRANRDRQLLVCVTEVHRSSDILRLAEALTEATR